MERLYLKPMLCKAIDEYCKLNGIDDVNAFANRCATQGFNIVKFGLSPKDNIERENNGIKDIKNESRRKRKEQPGVLEKENKEANKKDAGTVVQGKEEIEEPVESKLDNCRTNEEKGEPVEKGKKVTVRKIVVIKKDKKDD